MIASACVFASDRMPHCLSFCLRNSLFTLSFAAKDNVNEALLKFARQIDKRSSSSESNRPRLLQFPIHEIANSIIPYHKDTIKVPIYACHIYEKTQTDCNRILILTNRNELRCDYNLIKVAEQAENLYIELILYII